MSIDLNPIVFISGLLNKESLRTNVKDYVSGSKLMIHLEEEAQAQYLKRFDQSDIQITFNVDRQYYFPVTVRHPIQQLNRWKIEFI